MMMIDDYTTVTTLETLGGRILSQTTENVKMSYRNVKN